LEQDVDSKTRKNKLKHKTESSNTTPALDGEQQEHKVKDKTSSTTKPMPEDISDKKQKQRTKGKEVTELKEVVVQPASSEEQHNPNKQSSFFVAEGYSIAWKNLTYKVTVKPHFWERNKQEVEKTLIEDGCGYVKPGRTKADHIMLMH
jgi:hypothetical protein